MMRYAIFLIFWAMTLCSGCGAMFGNDKQYTEGDWYLLASSNEVARMRQDKLALEKLKAQPVQTATVENVPQGYKGIVANLSGYRINIHIDGPEKKRYFLGPGQSEDDYLVPGKYVATAYSGSNLRGTWPFKVGAEQYSYMGEKLHWYVFHDP